MRTLLALAWCAAVATAQDWSGEWLTDYGLMRLTQDGKDVTGTYGTGKSIEGKADGTRLTFTWREGRNVGDGEFALAKGNAFFSGTFKQADGRDGGNWRGWRKDPKAVKGRPAKFAGVWRSSLGMLVLEQKGNKVTGTWGSEGWSTIEGTVTGRRLNFTWKRIGWSGPAWVEITKDGGAFFGMTEEQRFTKWLGQRLEGYQRKAKPKAGQIVNGLSENHMCYYLRAPKGWRRGKNVDAIVLLHGSNWVSKGMVWVTAKNWPDLSDRFMIIGIDGQNWADWSKADDPRQNYTYANWMGKSTYKGYPYTDRESPYLVHRVVQELKERHKLDRVFVGGHSQGGFLTSALVMHHPETFAGGMLVSCALLMQSEPDVFDDEELRKAQRATPIAVVHGTADEAVAFSSGQYTYERFAASGFPMLGLFTKDVGHPYDFLPVGDAICWMDALTTTDSDALLVFAEDRATQKGWRDVAAALLRARELKASAKFKEVAARLDAAAKEKADAFRAKIEANADNRWIDPFLLWRDRFEFAPAAQKTMAAFAKLRDAHDPEAERLVGEARQAFQQGDQTTGWAKYQEVVDTYYAARRYAVVKRWLANRK